MFNAANALLAQCVCLLLHIFIYDAHQNENGQWVMCLLLRNGAISYLDVHAHTSSLGEITPQ